MEEFIHSSDSHVEHRNTIRVAPLCPPRSSSMRFVDEDFLANKYVTTCRQVMGSYIITLT